MNIRNLKNTFIILCGIFLPVQLFAQHNNYNQEIIIQPFKDTSIAFHGTVIPNSIQWYIGDNSVNIPYTLEENIIYPDWTKVTPEIEKVILKVNLLPFPFHEALMSADSNQIIFEERDMSTIAVENKRPEENQGLIYNGALTRGFSIGNNQSLVFDSELNLQLSGNIGDGYQVRAAITDNNLPIQPDGTTRQLQEFDKVFIEIHKDRHQILAGDFDVASNGLHFLRYSRKLKGAQYQLAPAINEHWKIKTFAAVARGKFVRQSIIPAEGNQGPYPLRGENGEIFIIVLAGSERVYLDGQLLIRGEDAHYTIDYNTSEISFTKNILINTRHRIIVEFEYAQFNFQKSNSALEIGYSNSKFQSTLHFFQENDSKNITGDLDLTQEDLLALQAAGDNEALFLKSGIRQPPQETSTNTILYIQKDTFQNNQTYQNILVRITVPQPGAVTATFTEVGSGNGNYVISSNPSPNGRVYEWISPDPVTGLSRGDFEPVIPLAAPAQKQMLTGHFQYALPHGGRITSELALNKHDFNRYSSLDDGDNFGLAGKLEIRSPFTLNSKLMVTPVLYFESLAEHFRTIDPIRSAEFARDWNLLLYSGPGEEHLFGGGIRIGKSKTQFIQYSVDALNKPGQYNGIRHSALIYSDSTRWKVNGGISALNTKDIFHTTSFFRPSFNIIYKILSNGLSIGGQYYEDINSIRSIANDSLLPSSFIQNKMSLYLENDPKELNHIHFSYAHERPKMAFGNDFRLSEIANEWAVTGKYTSTKNLQLHYTIRHRNSKAQFPFSGNNTSTLLGRLDWKTLLIGESLQWTGGYELGSGQEPRAEYVYIKVQKGEGFYIWIDDGDGIEEIHEFESAPFADEGEYIKLNVQNNTFIRTRALQIQQSAQLDLKKIWNTGPLSKISFLSSYQLHRKLEEEMASAYWNPFFNAYADSLILSYTRTIRNIFYWNRSGANYDIQTAQILQYNQFLQTSGYEIRALKEYYLRARFNMAKKMDLVLHARLGNRYAETQFFPSKNYQISKKETGPEINAVINAKWRLSGSYLYQEQMHKEGGEYLTAHKISFEGTWRRTAQMDIRAMISLSDIRYAGSGNTYVDFAMLQGYQPGINILWTAQWNTRINKSLILSLQYHGRDTGAAKTIHTGNAQIKAAF